MVDLGRVIVDDGWLEAWRSVDECDPPGLSDEDKRARAKAAWLVKSAIDGRSQNIEYLLSADASDGGHFWHIRVGKWLRGIWDELRNVDSGILQPTRAVADTHLSIWPHPDYPLVHSRRCYESDDCYRAKKSLGLLSTRKPELPDHALLADWQSDHFPCETTVEAFEQWCRFATEWLMPTWVLARKDIYGVKPWEEVDDHARMLIRDAQAIVRFCQEELGFLNPPDESRGSEFSLNDARIELRRAREWLAANMRAGKVPARQASPVDESEQTEQEAINEDCSRTEHAVDFRSVLWNGEEYRFTKLQAACIKVLWQHWEKRTPDVGEATILEVVESNQTRLIGVFDNGRHPAWGTVISPGSTKGTVRLLGEPPENQKPAAKHAGGPAGTP